MSKYKEWGILISVALLLGWGALFFFGKKKETDSKAAKENSSHRIEAQEVSEHLPSEKSAAQSSLKDIIGDPNYISLFNFKTWLGMLEKEAFLTATEELRELMGDHPRLDVWELFYAAWAAKNPGEAFGWLVESQIATGMADAIMREWVKQDRFGARNRLIGLRTESEIRSYTDCYTRAAMAAYEAETIEWISALSDGPLKQVALATAAYHYADNKRFEEASEWLLSLGQSPSLAEAAGVLAGEWGVNDTEAAWAFCQAIPEGTLRREVVFSYADRLAGENPPEFAEWLKEMPPGIDRDIAMERLIFMIEIPHPEVAVEWVDNIEDPEIQRTTLKRVLRYWFTHQREAAVAWFEANNLALPPEAFENAAP